MYNPHTLATCTVEWFLVYSELCKLSPLQTIFITLKETLNPLGAVMTPFVPVAPRLWQPLVYLSLWTCLFQTFHFNGTSFILGTV